MLWPPARWAEDGRIHLRYAAPHRPPTLATVPSEPGADWWLAPDADTDAGVGWSDAGTADLPGPAGPIETIVYGGPGWRRARHLVIALHGGPLASWRLDFEPLLQHLAAVGVAVAAPNQRGSTGYGEAHLRPVIGDWGGADLDDIVHLAREIGRDRAAACRAPSCSAAATAPSWRCSPPAAPRGCGRAASRWPPSPPPPDCTAARPAPSGTAWHG